MVTLTSGLLGGLVATLVMSALMMRFGDDSPPPTAVFWARYVGDGDPADYQMLGMLLHLGYGTVAGGVFAAVVPLLGVVSVAAVVPAVLWGLAYGVVLFVVAAVFWMNLILGMEAEMKQAGVFLLFHLVYGAVLGAWLGYGILG